MATWVRQGTGTAPSATDNNLVGVYALDNATAPGDFDPAAVTSVRTQWSITGSGFVDDSFDDGACALVTGATEISQHPSSGTTGNQNVTVNNDHTDSTGIPTGLSVAQWEAAELRGDGTVIPNEWCLWVKVKGTDGSTIAISLATVTITYTPAAAGPNEGSASGAIGWVGSATGEFTSEGAASGSIVWVGSADGVAPSGGGSGPPTVTSRAQGTNAATTTHAVTLGAGTADKLIVVGFAVTDPGAITPPTGWTTLKTGSNVGGAGSDVYSVVFGRSATSDTSVSFTTANSVVSDWISTVYSGSDLSSVVIPNPAVQSGTAAPDPPASGALTSGDYLIDTAIIFGGTRTVTAYPTGYDEGQEANAGAEPNVAQAADGLTGITSADPGAYTVSGTVRPVAYTIALPAAPGGGTSEGAASGTISWVGSADGAASHEGAASGSIAWVGSADGVAPTVGQQDGSASGSITWAGSATGEATHEGAASGSISWVGSAQGESPTAPPPSLSTDEIGIIGHSNSSTFVQYYRADSAQDLIVFLNQGSQDAQSWGDPTHGDFAAAWAELDGGEPAGGYKAILVFLGFKQSWEGTFDSTDFEAWADEVYSQITTRYPGVYIWWSPMNTYFATNPGDGDSEDLVALDPWGTNPSGLSTWKASDIESQRSWETLQYAISQGYVDDYGPWINLTDAETGTDNRHPEEPGGAQHGADVLLEFFEPGANPLSTGSASGSITWVGSADGTTDREGSASGAIGWVGSADGVANHEGSAAGSVAWSGSATGEAPTVGQQDGSANGSISWVGSATGEATHEGSATGAIAWVGSADGSAPVVGGAAGSAAGSITWTGSADGSTTHEGSSAGSVTWVGSAAGVAPSVGDAEGSATGTISWAGSADGQSDYEGSVSGAISWVGSASGRWPTQRLRLEGRNVSGRGTEGSPSGVGLEGTRL